MKICLGQNFTAAQRKQLGWSNIPLTKKNNLSIFIISALEFLFMICHGFDKEMIKVDKLCKMNS